MIRYKYIFVVLVYKNTDVLDAFFDSIKKNDSYRVILVDSFFSEEVRNKCNDYANKYDADFISIQNKGYSFGNNAGIEYTLNKYEFDFLIISNSDIIVNKLDKLDKFKGINCIIAPNIKKLTNKKQNPNIVFYSNLLFFILDKYFESDYKLYGVIAHMITRAQREIFAFLSFFSKKESFNIFSAHGSFLIFTDISLKKLNPIFNESMFLYNEEGYLAYKARYFNIPIYYVPSIKITHIEGASTNTKNVMYRNENKRSYIIMRKCFRESNFESHTKF